MDMQFSKLMPFLTVVLGLITTYSTLTVTVASLPADDQSFQHIVKLLTITQQRQTPERLIEAVGPSLFVQQFNVATCNKTAPIQGTASVTPDPIKIPGNVTVEFKGSVGVNVTSPTKVVLKVEKKVFVWVEIPCVDNLGSCTYDDGCKMIPFKPGQPCPAPLSTYNLPCTCPFKKGIYNLPKSNAEIPQTDLPEWLTDGDYKINVQLYDTKNTQLACFDIVLSLSN